MKAVFLRTPIRLRTLSCNNNFTSIFTVRNCFTFFTDEIDKSVIVFAYTLEIMNIIGKYCKGLAQYLPKEEDEHHITCLCGGIKLKCNSTKY